MRVFRMSNIDGSVFQGMKRGVYVVGKRRIDEVNRKSPYRRLWIDQYSGKIIHDRDRSTRTTGDIFVEWLYPLHTGEVFGFTGQLIILISGLVPLMLYVTGIIRWLQKRRVRKVREIAVLRVNRRIDLPKGNPP